MLYSGQVLQERYQLQQKLHENAARQTWLATDLKTSDSKSNQVVVKLLAFSRGMQWDDLKLFEREAQILKQLNHPYIPKYRDYFCIDDRILWFGLVQEYIAGSSLKAQLAQGRRFTEQQILKIAVEVLKILMYLHELNPPVLHRDIKPSNLILGEDEQVYLIDFGAVQDKAVKEGVTFTVVGTYGYTPIEQFGGRAVPASDLYALGATLIHLLTGIAPAELPQNNLKIEFTNRVKLSSSFVSWLQKLIEPAPEKRFLSARVALEALKFNGIGNNSGIQSVIAASINNLGQSKLSTSSVSVPNEIKGWNWGAFLLPWLWLLTNRRISIGLVGWIPPLSLMTMVYFGMYGNELAWKSRQWQSVEQFKAHQKGWAIAGIVLGIPVTFMVWQVAYKLFLNLFYGG